MTDPDGVDTDPDPTVKQKPHPDPNLENTRVRNLFTLNQQNSSIINFVSNERKLKKTKKNSVSFLKG